MGPPTTSLGGVGGGTGCPQTGLGGAGGAKAGLVAGGGCRDPCSDGLIELALRDAFRSGQWIQSRTGQVNKEKPSGLFCTLDNCLKTGADKRNPIVYLKQSIATAFDVIDAT